MPPTFLLVAFIILLSFAAPIAFVGALVLRTRPHTRRLGERMLGWGGCAAFGTIAANAALQALLHDSPTQGGMLIGGGAAFTIACGVAIVRSDGGSQPST
jgi:hypothetical protein